MSDTQKHTPSASDFASKHGSYDPTYICGPYAIGRGACWATDGVKEASTGGFLQSVSWLEEACGMPREVAKAFLNLREV